MQATTIVTGHFLSAGEQLQITLEAIDVETNRSLWRATLKVPVQNLIAMQEQIATQAQVGLASALGASALTADAAARPTNDEAYDLYLRSAAVPDGPDSDKQAIGMLERSVGLDPNYAPAWISLGRRYYTESRFESQTGSTGPTGGLWTRPLGCWQRFGASAWSLTQPAVRGLRFRPASHQTGAEGYTTMFEWRLREKNR